MGTTVYRTMAKAPAEDDKGMVWERSAGTPQGGVISPLLANLFLHYAFDTWMERTHGGNPFERYADDIVIHCRTQAEAEGLLGEIKLRLAESKLAVHPEKTKIVYCKDRNRREKYERTEFDFLGFTFRPRTARGKNGKLFLPFPSDQPEIRAGDQGYDPEMANPEGRDCDPRRFVQVV